MAYKLTIPFYAFRLHFSPGISFLNPLRDKGTYRTGLALKNLADQYRSAIQKKVLNHGEALKLLNEWNAEDFTKTTALVNFPSAKDGIIYPEFAIEFDLYYQSINEGFWGVVPVLGVEAHAKSLENLEKNIVETIKIEFARNNYLSSVQNIISTLWYNETELLRSDIDLTVADPGEDLNKKSAEQNTRILRKVARKLEIKKTEAYGREKELAELEQILQSNFSKNILVVGPSGVGKTALVWEICRQMKDRKIPGTIWETTASNIIKELSGDQGWEFNVSEMCRELKGAEHQYLFIRRLMDLFEVGKYVGNNVSMADFLLPFISKGEINIISECTDEELARIELESPTYTANFQIIRLEAPREDLEGVILKKINDISENTQVVIEKEAIKEVIRLIRRFSPYAGMPGRPIRFLESIMLNKTNGDKQQQSINLGRTEVIEHFCDDSGMPLFMVDPAITMDPELIKEKFNNNVFGQEMAVNSLVDIMAAVKAALTRTGKPIASFLFVGPTGVGKTELAKVLAEFMFGRRNRILRFDMSEYSNPYSVMRLIGQDSRSEGQLTAAVRREPFSVLLFDEIEKADSTFFDLLLQVLSEGRLTDNRGNLANFCSTIIIMTSNIGASNMALNPIGIRKQVNEQDVNDHFESAVRKHFRPELYNRIDKIIPFKHLDQDTVRFVVDREIQLFRNLEGIKFRKLDLDIDDEVYDFLAEKGYDSRYGARYLQRTIRECLLIPLAQELNQADYDDQILLKISASKEKLIIESHADPLALELLLEELNKIQNADYAATCRKNANQFQEGYHFTMLLQHLDQLEDKKKRRKEHFWKSKVDAERLSALLDLKKRMEELETQISSSEKELALMALDLKTYTTASLDRLEVWEKDMFELKVDIYSSLFPNINTCYFSIFGRNPERIFLFYLQFFEEKELNFNISAIWYDESHKAQSKVDTYQINGNIDINKFKKEKILAAPNKHSTLMGFRCVLKGRAALLYLQGESGNQKWLLPGEKEARLFGVEADEKEIEIPKNIHRKDFLKKMGISRSYNGKEFKDANRGLNREMSFSQIYPYIKDMLEDRFKANILLEMG